MSINLITTLIRLLPTMFIIYISSLILGLEAFDMKIILFSIVIFILGIVYGVILVYQTPSPEFMQMLNEEQEELNEDN